MAAKMHDAKRKIQRQPADRICGSAICFCGICSLADVSPLLGCMSMGTIYINLSDDDKLFKQLNYFSPPILLLFFVRSVFLSGWMHFLIRQQAKMGLLF